MAEQVTVCGTISFQGGAPSSLPASSQLTVKLDDVSRACAPSINLGKQVVSVENYSPGTPLKYSITAPRPEKTAPGFHAVSAVLNVGWAAKPEGDEWLRQGDYLNDTRHDVNLSPSEGNEIHRDVEIKLYKHD